MLIIKPMILALLKLCFFRKASYCKRQGVHLYPSDTETAIGKSLGGSRGRDRQVPGPAALGWGWGGGSRSRERGVWQPGYLSD